MINYIKVGEYQILQLIRDLLWIHSFLDSEGQQRLAKQKLAESCQRMLKYKILQNLGELVRTKFH